MSAPERIWANGLGCYGTEDRDGVPYLRADIAASQLAEAKAERDHWQKLHDDRTRFLGAAEAERDRLAADNARLREALQKILNEHDILSGNYGDVMDPRHIKPDRWPDAANKARAALSSPPATADRWRTMDSAPKDGTWIEAYRPRKEGQIGYMDRVVIVRWHDEIGAWVWPDQPFDIWEDDLDEPDGRGFHRVDLFESNEFTHYRPLPAAPTATGGR